MTRPLIFIGDKTSHGGTVVGGSSFTSSHGRMVARVGDAVTCPKCGRDTVVASGDPSLVIDGQPAARDGDLTTCGAALIAGQSSTASV